MKKLISLILTLVSVACVFCGCGNVKFESDKAMYDYLKGTWKYSYDEYLIFDGESVYMCNNSKYTDYFKEAFLKAWTEGGEEAFNSLTFEKALENILLDKIAFKYTDVANYASKGTIKIDEDSKFCGIIQIKEKAVEYKDKYSDDFGTLEKVSDEIDFNVEIIKENYQKLKEKYQLPVKEFIPTLKEYAEKLKKVFPDISNWKLAHDAEKSTIYSDTGSTTNYQEVIIISDETVMLSKYNMNLLITYNANADSDMPSLFIQDKSGFHLSEVLESLEVFLEDYPKAMDMDELTKQLEENGKVSSGQRIYETTVDGIKYKIQRSNGSGSTMLWIYL